MARLVTDDAENRSWDKSYFIPFSGNGAWGRTDPAAYDAPKKKGVQEAVLVLTYNYSSIVPYTGVIANSMKSCASPGMYFEGISQTEMVNAFTKMFGKVLEGAKTVRIAK